MVLSHFRCCGNPVLKTRVMAAKAIQPLVDKDHVILVFHDLLTLLPCQQTDVLHQNQIHGILLQVVHIFIVLFCSVDTNLIA